jgi:small subunit ribosomal protein S8
LLQEAGTRGTAPRGEKIELVGVIMSTTDPIADMLTRIRNAIMARHDSVLIPASKTKISIAKVLREEGYITDYEILKSDVPQRVLKIHLKYMGKKEPALGGLKRVSKPGLRVYVKKGEIPRLYEGLGITILSTSLGIMTGKQAWHKGTGGEVLCYVW